MVQHCQLQRRTAYFYLVSSAFVCSPNHSYFLLLYLQVAQKMEVDAKWVDNEAHHQLDIVLVLDQSGSVGVDNYARAKQWIRSFLDFFSVSKQYTQVSKSCTSISSSLPLTLEEGI